MVYIYDFFKVSNIKSFEIEFDQRTKDGKKEVTFRDSRSKNRFDPRFMHTLYMYEHLCCNVFPVQSTHDHKIHIRRFTFV